MGGPDTASLGRRTLCPDFEHARAPFPGPVATGVLLLSVVGTSVPHFSAPFCAWSHASKHGPGEPNVLDNRESLNTPHHDEPASVSLNGQFCLTRSSPSGRTTT